MTKKDQNIEHIVLEYDLYDLPTAQHKAGLAGFMLFIRVMERRKMPNPPKILKMDSTSACIQISKETLQAVFDDLYDAVEIETSSKSKWSKKEPKRIEDQIIPSEDGKTKKQKIFYYDVIAPKGSFFRALFPDGDGLWLKLWRNMLWETLRAIPKTRLIYEKRVTSKHTSEAGVIWKELVQNEQLQSKGKVKTKQIISSVFVGMQGLNAELAPFTDMVQQNLLLHFWTIVSLIFVPRAISPKGESKYKGYVLAIPEPADLELFLDEVDKLLRSLDTDSAGFRPKASLIDMPEEGGLEYLYLLTKQRVRNSQLSFTISAVELYHLEKQGHNVKTHTAERVLPNPGILNQYDSVRGTFFNPLYKSQRLVNLLKDLPWYTGMEGKFNQYPWEFFIHSMGKTPRAFRFFGLDVRSEMKARKQDLEAIGGDLSMSENQLEDKLSLRIYQLIRSYVNRKTEEKSGKKYKDFKDHKDKNGHTIYPKEYQEARSKVCSDAFLAMRSRRDKAFIEYFTGSICSVPQYLPEQDYLAVSQALMEQWENVKTLSMLSLSAHSYLSEPKQDKGE